MGVDGGVETTHCKQASNIHVTTLECGENWVLGTLAHNADVGLPWPELCASHRSPPKTAGCQVPFSQLKVPLCSTLRAINNKQS